MPDPAPVVPAPHTAAFGELTDAEKSAAAERWAVYINSKHRRGSQ